MAPRFGKFLFRLRTSKSDFPVTNSGLTTIELRHTLGLLKNVGIAIFKFSSQSYNPELEAANRMNEVLQNSQYQYNDLSEQQKDTAAILLAADYNKYMYNIEKLKKDAIKFTKSELEPKEFTQKDLESILRLLNKYGANTFAYHMDLGHQILKIATLMNIVINNPSGEFKDLDEQQKNEAALFLATNHKKYSDNPKALEADLNKLKSKHLSTPSKRSR